jgi:hypothetical protein
LFEREACARDRVADLERLEELAERLEEPELPERPEDPEPPERLDEPERRRAALDWLDPRDPLFDA